jgi:hypothetical protein
MRTLDAFNLRTAAVCVGVLAVAAVTASSSGCQSVTNTTAVQCLSEAECLSLGPDFAGTTCDPNTKTCVKAPGAEGTCAKNQECIDRAGGAPAICRKSDRKCVLLTSPECPTVLTKAGNVELADDNVIVIGAMTPELDTELGTVMQRCVGLAQYEISNNYLHGLPPVPGGTAARPLAIVSCREFTGGVEGLLRGAKHLVQEVQVPLVIGPVDPTHGGIVWAQVTNPNRVLAIAPTAITSGLNNIPNPIAPTPIIWRLNFDDHAIFQLTQAFLANQVEPALNAKGIDPIKVAAVYSGDALGLSLSASGSKTIKFNKDGSGQPMTAAANQAAGNFLPINYGDLIDTLNNPDPEAKIAGALTAIRQFQPNVILHEYAPAGIAKIYFAVEGAWPMGVPRPYHIGTHSTFNGFGPLFPFLTAGSGDPTNRRNGRFFAVQNYTSTTAPPFPPNSDQVTNFVNRFNQFAPEFAQSASTRAQLAWLLYDATYLAAYAITALRDKPVTGENIASTLPLLSGQGVVINTFDDAPNATMTKAFAELTAGRGIDMQGLYGTMDFDTTVAGPTYALEITCPLVPGAPPTTTGMTGSGFHVKLDGTAVITDQATGAEGSPTGPMPRCPPPPP